LTRYSPTRWLACVLLGTASAIGSAWVCKIGYAMSPSRSPEAWTERHRDGEWIVSAWRPPGRRSYTITHIDSFAYPGVRLDDLLLRRADGSAASAGPLALDLESSREQPGPRAPTWVRRPVPGGAIDQLATGAYGWPVVCMKGEMEVRASGSQHVGAWLVAPRQPGWSMDLALPLVPLPGGLAVSSAAWSLIWAGGFVLVPALRRHARAAVGCCPACGYDLTGVPSPRCPECGGDGETPCGDGTNRRWV
jgi:hypothetical protein